MANLTPHEERRALTRWARDQGYADFDTFVRTGGSLIEARKDIRTRIAELVMALNALDRHAGTEPAPSAREAELHRAEAEQCGAQAGIQGFDHGGA